MANVTPPEIVESYLIGLASDPLRRLASFRFRTPHGERRFDLRVNDVDRLLVNEFSQQNIVHEVRVLVDDSDPERVRDLLALLLFGRDRASDVTEHAFRAQLEAHAVDVFERRKLLLEIEPVYGASVSLLCGSIEWTETSESTETCL